MSTDLPSVETLRRTRSTGDIPVTDVPRPERVLLPPRHSESHSSSITAVPTTSSTVLDQPRSASVPNSSVAPRPPPSSIWTLSRPLVEDSQRDVASPEEPPRGQNRSLYSKVLAFFGYGRNPSRVRKELVALIWSVSWGCAQIIAITVVLSLSSVLVSPTSPPLNEWQACDKPLGVWCCLWIIRASLACILAYWTWIRERGAILRGDAESNHTTAGQSAQTAHNRTGTARPNPVSVGTTGTNQPTNGSNHSPPRSLLYSRLILLYSLLTLTWFITAHILEYTSVYTCRRSSPHLWWLTFGILSVMYIKVIEVLFLGLAVCIVAPILFLFWNILLICLGRHPLQNPAASIKPEIEKLPKAIIDAIPLVMYIPPPPDEPSNGPITLPESIHVYPPKQTRPVPLKKRFRFLRRKTTKEKLAADGTETKGGSSQEKKADEMRWEDYWEQGEYPFVRLEGNRAACAICLLDFAEPKRINGVGDEKGKSKDEGHSRSEGEGQNVLNREVMEVNREAQLKLTDAGEGPQPLRLLECGHVFHKTCLDPWLHDVSGRCPLCQRAVVIPVPERRRRRR